MNAPGLALLAALAATLPITSHADGPSPDLRSVNAGDGARHRAGMGWRQLGPANGGNRRPSNRCSCSTRKRRMGEAAFGAAPARMGSVRLARCPYLLGLGSQRRRLRLSRPTGPVAVAAPLIIQSGIARLFSFGRVTSSGAAALQQG